MPLSIEDLLGKVKRPVRSTRVCLDGELWARHDELSQQIDALRAEAGPVRMGDTSGVAALRKELSDVERAMQAAEVEFKFQGLSSYKRDEIIARFPAKDGRGWDTTAGAHALFAAASIEPVMDEDQAKRLVESIDHGATAKLFTCAWSATEGSADVPFFGRASASISDSASK
jgi:hypothetical protein